MKVDWWLEKLLQVVLFPLRLTKLGFAGYENAQIVIRRLIEFVAAIKFFGIFHDTLSGVFKLLSTLAHPGHWLDNEWDGSEPEKRVGFLRR